jgi:hypothetical protein
MSVQIRTIRLSPRTLRLSEELEAQRTRNEVYDNYGICPKSYKGCQGARDGEHFDAVCSKIPEPLDCVLFYGSAHSEVAA